MLAAAARLARLGSAVVSALAAVLMAVLLAFGGFALWQDAAVSRGAFASADLLQYKPADKSTAAPTLAELQALNPDVCGWLTIDGTHIDYPLVQGATNMDYINRDVYGEFSLSGAVFLDSRSKADFSDGYSIVYAHHMENGAMFGDISKFVQADYFAAHPSGSLILPDAAYEIELFVCLEADAYDAEIYAVERYTADTAALLDAVQARAVQQRALDVGSQDRLIALSTCAGAETNGRVMLLGRLRPATLDEGDETQ